MSHSYVLVALITLMVFLILLCISLIKRLRAYKKYLKIHERAQSIRDYYNQDLEGCDYDALVSLLFKLSKE